MSYTALYRKFRPGSFEDVKGQEHIVTTLKNQIKAGRIGHAYLFCGTRGTGKTTIAKIFARAVNCESPVEGSCCGKCAMCRAITSGASMNVIEIDAASNNGVDNIREIVDEVAYSPAEGRYKVYIIDEVHMLSIGAFNALLKTLEEPPSYVIFILATTEVHKIPVTILSRCQRYDFKRISIETIAARLEELMQEEGIQAEEKALRYIARMADGSMRDALSLLDQCIAFHFGELLTYDKALEVLGAVDTAVFGRLLELVLSSDVTGCIELLEEIVMQGRELSQFVADFTWYLRNLLLVQSSEGIEDVINVSSENMARLKEEAQMTDTDTIMRYIRIFSELSGKIRYAPQKRILLEVALIKLCKPSMETDTESMLGRIQELERRIEKGLVAASGKDESSRGPVEVARSSPAAAAFPRAIPEEVEAVAERWPSIAAGMEQPMKAYLKNARLSLGGDNRLVLVVEDGPASDYLLGNQEHRDWLQKMISDSVQREIEIEVKSISEKEDFDSSYIDLSKVIHMEIEMEGE